MKTPLSIKVLRKMNPLWTRLGIEAEALERIVALKLVMDSRKTSVLSQNTKLRSGKFGYEDFVNLFVSFMLAILLISDDIPLFYSMTMIISTITLYTVFYILADFSTVILDLRDKNIIGMTPVNGATLHMAKLIHVTIYLCHIVGELICFPIIGILVFKGPICFVALIIETLMLALFAVFLTTMIYYVLMSLCSGEKLKDIINYFQVIFTIIVILMQQILPRMLQFMEGGITYSFHWWYYLIPPMWMASPFEVVTKGMSIDYLGLTLCSIIVPSVLFGIYVKKISPYFETKLMRMNAGTTKERSKGAKFYLGDRIGKWICKDQIEYSIYCFVRRLMTKERKYKLQMYPQIAMYAIFPFVFCLIVIDFDAPQSWWLQVRESRMYFTSYFISLCAALGLELCTKSESYKAAWIYKVAPLTSKEVVYCGMLKAVGVKYLLPSIIYQNLFIFTIWGLAVWPYAMVISVNTCSTFLMFFYGMEKAAPFSKAYTASGEHNAGPVIAITFLFFILIGAHYGISLVPYGNAAVGVVSLLAGVFFYIHGMKALRKQPL